MDERFSRSARMLGEAAIEKLARCHVAVFGIGGVGSFTAEALARAGIGKLTLVDSDTISITNINRQLHALSSTVGQKKTEVMAARIKDINPNIELRLIDDFFLPENKDKFMADYDYVVDAIDTVTGKIALVAECYARNIPIISSMGAGNKLDPTLFRVADIYATSVDPLAKVMRKKLRALGVNKLKVVYSTERPISSKDDGEAPAPGRNTVPGSISFVPSAAGLILASVVVRDILQLKTQSAV